VLAVMCPNILFRICANSFPIPPCAPFCAVMLNPVNFDMLYQQHKQEQAQAPTTTDETA